MKIFDMLGILNFKTATISEMTHEIIIPLFHYLLVSFFIIFIFISFIIYSFFLHMNVFALKNGLGLCSILTFLLKYVHTYVYKEIYIYI